MVECEIAIGVDDYVAKNKWSSTGQESYLSSCWLIELTVEGSSGGRDT